MGGGGEGSDDGIEVKKADGGDAVAVNIRCSSGTKFAVQVSLESSVESFKSVLAQNCDIPAKQQRLIYKGRIFKDDQTLKSYGLEAEHIVHLVRGFVPAESNKSAGTATTRALPSITPSGATVDLELEQIQQQLTQNPNMIVKLTQNPNMIVKFNFTKLSQG